MKKQDLKKSKRIIFEKLTVKETGKTRGGDPLFPLTPSDSCQEIENTEGLVTLRPPIPVNNCV